MRWAIWAEEGARGRKKWDVATAAKGVPHGGGGRGGSGPDRRATLQSAAACGRRLQASDVHAHETSTKIGEVGPRHSPGRQGQTV
jgi:hypothetical protein